MDIPYPPSKPPTSLLKISTSIDHQSSLVNNSSSGFDFYNELSLSKRQNSERQSQPLKETQNTSLNSDRANRENRKSEISIEDLGNKKSVFLFSIKKRFNLYRFSSLLCSFLFLISILSSVTLYYINHYKNKNTKPTLLSFHFTSSEYSPFQLNQYAFLFYLFILLLITISFSIVLIKNDYRFKSPFKEDLAILLPITLLCISVSFILGLVEMFYPKENFKEKIAIITLYAIAFITLALIYKKSKIRKNQAVITLINESFLVSIKLCFVIYVLLFTTSEFFIERFEMEKRKKIAIGFNVVFACISLILLTIYKDIIFTLCLFIIEGGLIGYNKSIWKWENLSVCIIIGFMAISLILTIWKKRKKVFGYDKEDDVIVTTPVSTN